MAKSRLSTLDLATDPKTSESPSLPPVAGRQHERRLFDRNLQSRKPELLAVYGRRRIGKTYLIREHFAQHMCFEMAGIHDASRGLQLKNFTEQFVAAARPRKTPEIPATWFDAFGMLRTYLQTLAQRSPKRRLVVFFDEVPWLASKKSGFLEALEHFWNSWGSKQPQLLVIVCGSAASWMIRHLIQNRGGLHNRVTHRIRLEPFTLGETREFLVNNGVKVNDKQVIELYMAMGGVPFYLEHVRPGLSAAQAIDEVCFAKDGLLRDEFQKLYASLYEHHERHIALVRALAASPQGMARNDLLTAAELPTGGRATATLDELMEAGFVTRFDPWGKTKKDSIYRLADEYSLFYLKWIEGRRLLGEGTWLKLRSTPGWKAWSGYAFENVCFRHLKQLKHALGISGVETSAASWVHRPTDDYDQGAQIDLLIDRRDDVINLCEMKFADAPFVIDKAYAAELRTKISTFRRVTATRKATMLTMVTPYGSVPNPHRLELVVNDIVADVLFG